MTTQQATAQQILDAVPTSIAKASYMFIDTSRKPEKPYLARPMVVGDKLIATDGFTMFIHKLPGYLPCGDVVLQLDACRKGVLTVDTTVKYFDDFWLPSGFLTILADFVHRSCDVGDMTFSPAYVARLHKAYCMVKGVSTANADHHRTEYPTHYAEDKAMIVIDDNTVAIMGRLAQPKADTSDIPSWVGG